MGRKKKIELWGSPSKNDSRGTKTRKKSDFSQYGSLSNEVLLHEEICQNIKRSAQDLRQMIKTHKSQKLCMLETPELKSIMPPVQMTIGLLPALEHVPQETVDTSLNQGESLGIQVSPTFDVDSVSIGASTPFYGYHRSTAESCSKGKLQKETLQDCTGIQSGSFQLDTGKVANVCKVFSCLLKDLAQNGIVIKTSSSWESTGVMPAFSDDRVLIPNSINMDHASQEVQSDPDHGELLEDQTVEQADIIESARSKGSGNSQELKKHQLDQEADIMIDVSCKEASISEAFQAHQDVEAAESQIHTLIDAKEGTEESDTESGWKRRWADLEVPESDGGDPLKRMWEDMDFCRACLNEQNNNALDSALDEAPGCDHDFILKYDVGLVCTLCGLVGRDIETMFDIDWWTPAKRKRSQRGPQEKAICTLTQETLDGLRDFKPSVMHNEAPSILSLHPAYSEKMHVHQKDGFQFLQRNLLGEVPGGCILAHAPGTGKTFLVIAFLQSFLTAYPDERPLIIAPKGMLNAWQREFKKWKVKDIPVLNLYDINTQAHGLKPEDSHIKQHRLKILEDWRQTKSILLMSYPIFSILMSDESTAPCTADIRKILVEVPGIMILDEGHFPRNQGTKIQEGLLQVQTRRRVLMSGTLFQNDFDELFNLFHLVRPDFLEGLLDPAFTDEKARGVGKISSSSPSKSGKKRSKREMQELKLFLSIGDLIKSGSKKEQITAITLLRNLAEPFVHWYKGQVLQDLPGLVDLTVILNLNQVQRETLAAVEATVDSAFLDWQNITAMVCIHPSLLKVELTQNQVESPRGAAPLMQLENDKRIHHWKGQDPNNSVKTKFVIDMLHLCASSRERVLIFCRLLAPMELLECMLTSLWGWRRNFEMLKIVGGMKLEDRDTIIDRFNQDPDVRVLFASIKTCGEGVSLIGASRVILLDIQWNPAVLRQAISRAFRIGQKKKVFVYRLVAGETLEEVAHARNCEKEWIAKRIFEDCDADEYEVYVHQVDPRAEDQLFESAELRQNVQKCYRCSFM